MHRDSTLLAQCAEGQTNVAGERGDPNERHAAETATLEAHERNGRPRKCRRCELLAATR
jgi:hypothetical protein